MNERLKELMLEAGYAAPELAGRANKLADLIVRECAKQIRMHAQFLEEEYPNKYFNDTAENCAELIEEHFEIIYKS